MTASSSPPSSRTALAPLSRCSSTLDFPPQRLLLLRFYCYFLILVSFFPRGAVAQLVNGQSFTNGLSIIDAPFPGSKHNANGNLPIAIETSGNGKIPLEAAYPGSNLPTRFDLLEIYLVSSQVNVNFTVSSGPDLLNNEKGSVRHKDFFIPACLPPGPYNVTFYEQSHVNDTALSVITPIPITIENKNGNADGSPCATLNPLQVQPQPGSGLPQSPFLPSNPIPIITVSIASQDIPPLSTINPGGSFLSGFATTVLVTSVFTTTAPGQTSPTTATVTAEVTTTVIRGDGGFIPANGSSRRASDGLLGWLLALVVLPCLLTWTTLVL